MRLHSESNMGAASPRGEGIEAWLVNWSGREALPCRRRCVEAAGGYRASGVPPRSTTLPRRLQCPSPALNRSVALGTSVALGGSYRYVAELRRALFNAPSRKDYRPLI